jgi:adenine-specific DNA-methyltransferase
MSKTMDDVTPELQDEKLDLRSHRVAEDRRRQLLHLFPEIRTEDGRLDFDRLKLALGEAVDVGRSATDSPGRARPRASRSFDASLRPHLPVMRGA